MEARKRPGTIIFFRTQSPRHFEGGDWDQGGSCQRLQPLLPQEASPLSLTTLHLSQIKSPTYSFFRHLKFSFSFLNWHELISFTKVNLLLQKLAIMLIRHGKVRLYTIKWHELAPSEQWVKGLQVRGSNKLTRLTRLSNGTATVPFYISYTCSIISLNMFSS